MICTSSYRNEAPFPLLTSLSTFNVFFDIYSHRVFRCVCIMFILVGYFYIPMSFNGQVASVEISDLSHKYKQHKTSVSISSNKIIQLRPNFFSSNYVIAYLQLLRCFIQQNYWMRNIGYHIKKKISDWFNWYLSIMMRNIRVSQQSN